MGIEKTTYLVLPIERLQERYSYQWWGWWERSCRKLRVKSEMVGSADPSAIHVGEFLDVYDTQRYKALQTAALVRRLVRLQQQPVTVVLHDGWHPAVETLAYIRSLAHHPITIKAVMHAGSYDPWDFLALNGCGVWAADVERGWMAAVDEVWVATHFHTHLLCNTRNLSPSKVQLVRWPVYCNSKLRAKPKKPWIVWPHRMAPEKNPEDWGEIVRRYRIRYGDGLGERFLQTTQLALNKGQYYSLLADCSVAVSTARQETFGIAMQEARNMGCVPVAPDRLAYPETIPDYPLYHDLDEAVDLVRRSLLEYDRPAVRYSDDMDDMVRRMTTCNTAL